MSKVKRGRLLRDQKANSIADLAAVLEKQALTAEEHEKAAAVRREAKRRLTDQASSLKAQKTEARKAYMANPTDETRAVYKKYKKESMKVKSVLRTPEESRLFAAVRKLQDAEGVEVSEALDQRTSKTGPATTMEGVKIEWAYLQDAEFARTWPAAVVHDALGRGGLRSRHVHSSSLQPPQAPGETADVSKKRDVVPRTTSRPQETTEASVPQPQTTLLTKLVQRLQFGRK